MKPKYYSLDQFRRWGRTGGLKSRRTLSVDQARAMVRAREAKKHNTHNTKP
jgi:hypothetical protein